jgi:transposase
MASHRSSKKVSKKVSKKLISKSETSDAVSSPNKNEVQEVSMSVVNPRAAGIDVGSKSHWVAVGQGTEDVQEFGVYSDDLHELCKWLKFKQIQTVALESTGTYWQNLFVMLQDYGLNPILVSGKFTKNVQGKKTDVKDCQWIQRLHLLGLLPNSYLPDSFTEKVRQYSRHRQGLIFNAADYIRKMQKSLRQMNIRLDIAISDVTGETGMAIIKAIIGGETNPKKLAQLRNYRIRKPIEELERALNGIFKAEYIFELKQSVELYEFFQAKIAECDKAIEQLLLEKIEDNEKQDGVQRRDFDKKDRKKKNKNSIDTDIEKLAFQLSDGIDLSEIDGVSSSTILAIISEIGMDVSDFPSAKHFTSWLRLSPNNKVSGGKVLSSRTSKKKNYLSRAFQRAANAVGSNLKKGPLFQFFNRIKAKKGHSGAIVATARKIATIVWNMLSKKEAFNYETDENYQTKIRQNSIKNIQRKLKNMNIQAHELVFN